MKTDLISIHVLCVFEALGTINHSLAKMRMRAIAGHRETGMEEVDWELCNVQLFISVKCVQF